jgi:hypothetical protein
VANDLPTVSHAGHIGASLADRLANPAGRYYRAENPMNALALIGGIVVCAIIAHGVAQIVIKTTTPPKNTRRK